MLEPPRGSAPPPRGNLGSAPDIASRQVDLQLTYLDGQVKILGKYQKQVRIQELVGGCNFRGCGHSGAELCERSKLSAAWVQGPLEGPRSFWDFNAQICIHPDFFFNF